MPFLPIEAEELCRGPSLGTLVRLAAVMLWPNDGPRRDAYARTATADELAQLAQNESQSATFVPADVVAPAIHFARTTPLRGEFERDGSEAYRRGIWTGQVLLRVLSSERRAPGTMRLQDAKKHVAQLRGPDGRGLLLSGGPRKLDMAWGRYRPVAHLWAGAIEEARLRNDVGRYFPCPAARLLSFLVFSEHIRVEGETRRLDRDSKPVLRGESWCLPDGIVRAKVERAIRRGPAAI